MRKFLASGKFFKLICAAGNENLQQVEKLVYIYSKAGCRFFDVAASKNIVEIAKNAIEKANLKDKIFLCASIGTKNDPHIQKAFIKEFCNHCGECIKICPQRAISDFKVKKNKCIGCSKCYNICDLNAIQLEAQKQDLQTFLPALINVGIDSIEFHISDFDDEVFEKWEWLNKNFDGILSVSIGSSKLKEVEVIAILDKLLKTRPPYTTIIQADGTPMSADKNDFATTQKCIETGLLIQKQNYKAYLNLAGGTNLKTATLSQEKSLNFDGIALGTFARKAVDNYIFDDNFWNDENLQQEAINIAKKIIAQTFPCQSQVIP
ncbi:MAG: LdpA C-terminal domain-containing domain [bacterium]